MDITIITIFVLAIFVGFEIITKVPPTLHTPLMSGSNAISGIAIIGALLATQLEGSIAITPTDKFSFLIRGISLFISELFPAPGGPVIPIL